MSKPTRPTPASSAQPLPLVRRVGLHQPLHWLGRAWCDLMHCGWISWAHGLVLALVGLFIAVVAHQRFWLLAGALSGFLLVAPVLATSLYALSRALERGEPADVRLVLKTWLNWHDQRLHRWGRASWRLVQFGALLALAGSGWVLTSAALITLLAPVPITTPGDFLHHVVLAREGFLFELWLALGGMLAAPIFASTVVAVPLLLDRQVTLLQAVLTSWQVVLLNPLPMALWAALILSLTLLGLGSALLGLVLVMPVLGHASWHAYRDLVDVSALPSWESR